MAVKVMVAPVIAKGDLGKSAARRTPAKKESAPRPRRRTSVYDADGNEVFITLMCLKCQKIRPLSQFGLRRMADGAIRNQPWCRTCRSAPSAREHDDRASVEPAASAESPIPGESQASPAAASPSGRPSPRSVAAEVAAALAAGRG
jgi:hypothetical protein